MLNGNGNVMTSPCNEINRTVPYFEEFTKDKYEKMDGMADYLATVVKSFASVSLDFNDRDARFSELDNLPDGAYKIRQANKKKLSYNM